MKEQQFDLRKSPLIVLEMTSILLPSKTPKNTMRNQPPNLKVLLPTQIYWPATKKIQHRGRHHTLIPNKPNTIDQSSLATKQCNNR